MKTTSIQCPSSHQFIKKISLQLESHPKAAKGKHKAAMYCYAKFKKKKTNERTREQIIAERFYDNFKGRAVSKPSQRTSSAFYPKNNKTSALNNYRNDQCGGEGESQSGSRSHEMIAQRNLVFLNSQQQIAVKKLARHQNMRRTCKPRVVIEGERLRTSTEPVSAQGSTTNYQTTISMYEGSDSQLVRSSYSRSHQVRLSQEVNRGTSTASINLKPQKRQAYPTNMINMSEYRQNGNEYDLSILEDIDKPILPICKKVTYQNVNKFYQLCIKTIENAKKKNKQDFEASNQQQIGSKTQHLGASEEGEAGRDHLLESSSSSQPKSANQPQVSIIDYYNFLNKTNKSNEIRISTQMTILPSKTKNNPAKQSQQSNALKTQSSLFIKKKLLDHKQYGERIHCQDVGKKVAKTRKPGKSPYHYCGGCKGCKRKAKIHEEDFVVQGWDTNWKEIPNIEEVQNS